MKRLIISMLAAAALTGQVLAQDSVVPNINEGTKVLEGAGSLTANTPGGDAWNLQLGYGYFIRDGLELGAVGGFADDDISAEYNLGVRAEYNFDLGTQWVPYVGLAALYYKVKVEEGDWDEDTFAGRGTVGIKYFLRNDLALSLSAQYTQAVDDIFLDENLDESSYQYGLLFGIRYYFD